MGANREGNNPIDGPAHGGGQGPFEGKASHGGRRGREARGGTSVIVGVNGSQGGGSIGEKTVRGIIYREKEGRKGQVTPGGVGQKGTTRATPTVDANGEEGHIQCRDMKAVNETHQVGSTKLDGDSAPA